VEKALGAHDMRNKLVVSYTYQCRSIAFLNATIVGRGGPFRARRAHPAALPVRSTHSRTLVSGNFGKRCQQTTSTTPSITAGGAGAISNNNKPGETGRRSTPPASAIPPLGKSEKVNRRFSTGRHRKNNDMGACSRTSPSRRTRNRGSRWKRSRLQHPQFFSTDRAAVDGQRPRAEHSVTSSAPRQPREMQLAAEVHL